MKNLCQVLVALTISVNAGHGTAGDATPGGNELGVLDRFAGAWTVEGKWSDGTPLHARSVYEWGLGKKIMRAQTFVKDGDREYQRYESVLAWHPEKKSLYEITFAYDGNINEVLIESKDKDTLQIGWTPIRADKPSPVRQVIQFLDQDRFRWTVTIEDGAGWKQIIDATWKRKSK
jgi:hypothetical protein